MLSNQDAANLRPAAGTRASRRTVLSTVLAAMTVHANTTPTTPPPRSTQTATTGADEALPQPRYTLQQLLGLARASHPTFTASQVQVQVTQMGITAARAWLNSEVETMTSRQQVRMSGATEGRTNNASITQRPDLPWRRAVRRQAADVAYEASQATTRSQARDVEADLKLHFYDVVRREAGQHSVREGVTLVEQIRHGVAVRVGTDEAPCYELIHDDAELLNAQRNEQAAALRVQQALAKLRRAVGADLPQTFDVDVGAEAPSAAHLPPSADLINTILAIHPELEAGHAAVHEANVRLAHERGQRWPSLALRRSIDRRPDLRDSHVGPVMSIPLFGHRGGPVNEVMATRECARALLHDRELHTCQATGSAYRQCEITESQVSTLESSVIKQAESALRTAEAAYRRGEHGVLGYLDAQRVFRQARNDLIVARTDLRTAAAELDRLRPEVP